MNEASLQLLPPKVPGLPIVGNVAAFMGDPLSFLRRCARQTGDVCRIRLGSLPFYLVNDPAVVEQVFVTQQRNFKKDRFARGLSEVLGEGLLTSEGDLWRRQRRLANPAFHRERIASYGAIMADYAGRATASWRDGEERDIHKDMMRLTLEIVAQTLFGAEVGSSAEVVSEVLDVVLSYLTSPLYAFLPFLREVPGPHRARFRRSVQRLDDVVMPIIRERRTSLAKATAAAGTHRDLLSMLLEARDDEGGDGAEARGMDDRQIRDEVMTLFLAGHETTALTLSWTWMLLSQNPHVEAQLAEELAQVLPGGRAPTLADLPRLRFTERVITESMRMYPPAWSIGREAIADTTLGGFHVPAGTQVWLSPWSIQRDARWFASPDEFRPDRWADDLGKRIPKYAYFPFGGGPRLCIGQSFALMESVLLLAAIAARFEVKLAAGAKIEVVPAVTLRPKDGMRVRVRKRAGVSAH